MMKVVGLLLTAGLGMVGLVFGEAQYPVFLNYDMTHFGCSRKGITPDEAHLRAMVRQYEPTAVTDFLFDLGGRMAGVTNSVMESWEDKYHQTVENGQAVSYTNNQMLAKYHEVEIVLGLDRFTIWIDEAHRIGRRVYLSFRMNDCHDCFAPTSMLSPNFFYAHPEYRRVRHRDFALGYFDRCYDYELAAVREQRLAYIAEMLNRYDADGIELDWMREVYCFQPGRENAAVINAVMARVRALAEAAAKRRGHPVKVHARVPADPETALRFGFDVAQWADERLVDSIAPSPRWETTYNNLPVDLWRRLLRGTGVKLLPCIEINAGAGGKHYLQTTSEQVIGAAAAYYSAGADGIYFFNYFDDPHWADPKRSYWQYGEGQPVELKAVWWANQLKWLKLVGSPAKVIDAPRDHLLTYCDIVSPEQTVRPPFQCMVEKDQVKVFRLMTGKVPARRKLTLRIGAWGGVPPAHVYVNSRPCRFLREEKCFPAFTDSPLYCYEVPALPEESALVEIIPDRLTELTFLDLQVRQ